MNKVRKAMQSVELLIGSVARILAASCNKGKVSDGRELAKVLLIDLSTEWTN